MDKNIKVPAEDKPSNTHAYMEQIKRDYDELFKSEAGVRVMKDLKRVANYEFIGHDVDSNKHFVHVGMIQLINHINNVQRFTAKQLIENDMRR